MRILMILFLALLGLNSSAQFWKKKDAADSSKTEESEKKKSGGPNLFTKLISKVAKVSGGAMQTTTASDLNEVTTSAYYQTNLPPASLGTMEMAFYEGWKEGGNIVALMFTRKDAYGFCKIDGSVTVDGKPASFATMGVYTAFSADNTKPKKVEVTTSRGQKASFTIQPPKQGVKILSINGSKDETVSIDPSKDVVLELEQPAGAEKTMLTVRLLVKSVGIPYWSEIGFFPSASRIVIPAAHLRNANNTNGALTNFKNSYFSVVRSTMEKASDVSGNIPALEYASMPMDGRFLKVSPDIELSRGIQLKASDSYADGSVQYEISKANAFSSRPIRQVRTIAPLSFSLRGVLYDYKEKKTYNIGDQSYTQSTRMIQFPQLPDAAWDEVLAGFYAEVTDLFREELGASLLPVEKVQAAPAYQRMDAFSRDDENTSVAISRGYKGLKVISAFVPVSEAWGVNSNLAKLFAETGANAVLKLTLDLQPAWQKNEAVMVPKLAMELAGPPNGEVYPTKYFTATIIGRGVATKDGKITMEELQRIVRRGDLMASLRKALKAAMAAEKANGDYDIVWPGK